MRKHLTVSQKLSWWQDRLDGWKEINDGWMAQCPAHPDSSASLHFTVKSDKDFVIHCFAGCDWNAIVGAASEMQSSDGVRSNPSSGATAAQVDSGQESSPIISIASGKSGLDEWASYTGIDRDEWESWGVVEKGHRIAFSWPGYKFQKVRGVRDKTFEWIGPKPSGPVLWPTPIEPGEIWLTEGESDCGILRSLGFRAHTFGGVESSRPDDAAEILSAWSVSEVTICFDVDRPGREASRELRDGLLDAGIRARILDISSITDKRSYEKDIRDVFQREGRELAKILSDLRASTSEAIVSIPSSEVQTDDDEVEWLCEPYLARGSLTLLCGVAKGGKTTWTFSLMREMRASATAGMARDFLGSHVTPGDVLYLSEDGRKAWNIRRKAHMRPEEDAHINVFFAGSRPAGTSWQEVVEIVEREAAAKKVTMIVVDTIPVWANIDNENDATQVNRALEPLRRLAESANVAVLAIHYFNKSGGFRGSTSFEAIPDILIDIDTDDAREVRTLSVRGKMSPQDPPELTYTMKYDNKSGQPAHLELLSTVQRPNEVLEAFRDTDIEGLSILEICVRLGFENVTMSDPKYHSVRRLVKKLVKDRMLIEDTTKRPHVYKRFINIKMRESEK